MKFTRRTGMAALAAAPLLAALPACNRGGGEGGGEDLDIALVSKGFQHQLWQAVQQGADAAAEEHGVICALLYSLPELEIGRADVRTPVTWPPRLPPSPR